jgi:pyruvate formate lyase activating enzyme
MTIPAHLTGRILHLQRLSTEDGPGIRTTVFFKGCPLHCAWCHNPESLSSKTQTQWMEARCLDCKTCVSTCPNGCLAMSDGVLTIDRVHCQACGKCVEACPSGALEVLGETISVEILLAELLKDRSFYEKSGGGVTLSGGEPTFQPDFAETLLRGLKAHGVATALDTSGLCPTSTLDRLIPFTDLVLFDLKLFDQNLHQKYTGVSNRQILENFLYLQDVIRKQEHPVNLWVRTPLIPGGSASDANLSAIGAFLADSSNGSVSRWELCAFNNLCRDQYTRLGLEWDYAHTPLLSAEELFHCEQVAKASGFSPERILATGATRTSKTQ